MAGVWIALVSALQKLIVFIAAATGGNVGLAIVTVSVAIRVALLPFTIRLARRAGQQQAKLAALQPELAQLKERFAKQPEVLAAETLALYRRNDVKLLDSSSIGVLLVQLPLISALYGAIARGIGAGRRFLWIKDLAKPDLLLVAITAALTYFTALFGGARDAARTAAVISAALTVIIMWRVSAALGLYWASSTAVGYVQTLWLRRRT